MCRTNYILLLLFLSSQIFALPSDKKKNVEISADNCVYNYKTGHSLFKGHVKIDQGTTHIVADKFTTKNNTEHKIREAIAYGDQALAHFWTRPKIDAAYIHAHAKVIKYYPVTANITLVEDVLVTQKNNHFHGQLIYYNMHDETIRIPASKNGRATLIYDPDK